MTNHKRVAWWAASIAGLVLLVVVVPLATGSYRLWGQDAYADINSGDMRHTRYVLFIPRQTIEQTLFSRRVHELGLACSPPEWRFGYASGPWVFLDGRAGFVIHACNDFTMAATAAGLTAESEAALYGEVLALMAADAPGTLSKIRGITAGITKTGE